VELNKICFIIFRFFYELLRIYQFSADLKNKRKGNWRFTLGTLKKFLFFFLFHRNDSGWADWADRRRERQKSNRRFCIGNSRKFFIFFLLFYKRWTEGGGDRLGKLNADRSGQKKILSRLKFWLFIDKYR